MNERLDSDINEAIDVVNYALTHPDQFPDSSRIGHAAYGALAVGADQETAVQHAHTIHTKEDLRDTNLFIAGALAVIKSRKES